MNAAVAPWRVLVADDDPAALASVRDALNDVPEVTVVAVASSVAEASRLLESSSPDLAILDVQLPDGTGLDVVEAVGVDRMPPVIFVTAYDRHAVRAFDLHAVDYVLKPFERTRLHAAVGKATRALALDRAEEMARALGALAGALASPFGAPAARPAGLLKRFVVRGADSIRLVDVDDVDWIEAAGNYVRLHVGDDTHDVRATLSGTLQRLDPDRFVRIHRSTAVNVDRVVEIHPWFGGDYIAVLEDGAQLRVSRTFKDRLLDD